MTRLPMTRLHRRRFLEVTGAGVAAVTLAPCLWPRARAGGRRHRALGQPARHDRGPRRLPLLGRHEIRLLRRHRDHARAGADRGDRDGQARRPGPGRHGLPLARRVLARPRAGHPAGLGLAHGRLRRVRLRLPPGREAGGREGDRGQDHPPGQRRLAGDRRSDARPDRRRARQRQLRRGRQPLGSGADAGPGRRRAVLGGAARAVEGPGPRPSTTSSAATSRSSPPTASSSAAPTTRTRPRRSCTRRICAPGRWGSSTATSIRAPRPTSCSSSSRRWPRRCSRRSRPNR